MSTSQPDQQPRTESSVNQDVQQQSSSSDQEQVTKEEKRDIKKKRRAKRNSKAKRFMTIVLVGIIILLIFHVMNNFDSVVGRDLVIIHDKYVYEDGKGYALVDTEGVHYWVSKEDWDSCAEGEEVKIYTNKDGASFVEKEKENPIQEMFK